MRRFRALAGLLALGLVCLAAGGCSLRRMALRQVAATLTEAGEGWASDPDPQLVADALPFALKTVESLILELPDDRGLRLTACRGFTQYAIAFVEADARRLRDTDFSRSEQLRQRALGLYERARGHCLAALESAWPGITAALRGGTAAPMLAEAKADDVPLLFWTGASWGAGIAASGGDVAWLADLGAVEALFGRALELDEAYDRGLLHQAMIPLSAVGGPRGDAQAARHHRDRALELAGGQAAAAHVAYAEAVLLPQQDRAAFEAELRQALEVNIDSVPALRLANVLAQQRARFLLSSMDLLFLDSGEETLEEASDSALEANDLADSSGESGEEDADEDDS